jgi:plastocyanin
MQATFDTPRVVAQAAPRPIPSFGWRSLAQGSAALATVLLFVAAVLLQDREALGLAVASMVGVGLLRWRDGLLGAVILAGIFTATLGFMLPGAVLNLAHGQSVLAYVLPLSLSAVSASGLCAAVAATVTRHRPLAGTAVAPQIAALALGVYAVALVGGVLASREHLQPVSASQLTISAKTNAFSTTTLVAQHGRLSVSFANQDLFWHTFTIDALGVDLRVPVNGEDAVSFEAAPGTYDFYCAIPGHATLMGMRGVLIVE